jgi:biopolymer transport protein ExbD
MSWKIRHAGSPKHVDISLPKIAEGLQEGQWEPTDEVVGPGDLRWTPIEKHAMLEDIVHDIEEAQELAGKVLDDPEEQRIDMNPLIDVCLVLLVFFILATTLQVVEKVLNVPSNRTEGPGKLVQKSEEEVKEVMIVVQVVHEGGRDVIKIEQKEVPQDDLERSLRRFVRETRKTELVIDAKSVAWGTVVKVLDAAAGAEIKKVHFKASPNVNVPTAAPTP